MMRKKYRLTSHYLSCVSEVKFVPRTMYSLHDEKEYNLIFLFEVSVWAHWLPILFLLQCMDS